MRLQRLNLTRYGIFTGQLIDFGPREPDQPDLHIVYGVNESGKSTALAAYLDLLFGIEPRSRYNFIHPYASMEIGAALEIGDESSELVRIKKSQNNLLDRSGQPVDEGILSAALSGIDRDAYQTMFSLDDDTLEAGGESILASKGDLGQLLFSASAGLAGLSHTLSELQDQVDGFHKARARNTELGSLKARLNELQAERKEFDTLASTYAQLVQARDTAKAGYDEAIELRAKAKARLDEIRRLLDGLPLLASFRKVQDGLSKLFDLPEPPGEWADEIVGLLENETKLTTMLRGVDDEIKRLQDELNAIEVDVSAIALRDRIDRLSESEARYRTAQDIPNRQLELNSITMEIGGILNRLEQEPDTDPKDLVLVASTVGTFQDLIESRSGIESQLQSAMKEHARAERELRKAQEAFKAMGGDTEGEGGQDFDHELLSTTIAAIQTDDHAARRRLAEKTKAKLDDDLGREIAALRPWQGDVAALAQLVVPVSAQIESWKASSQELQKQIDRHAGEFERLTTEREGRKAEIDAIKRSAKVVDDGEAAAVRARRDEAWSKHRSTLDVSTATAFEQALNRDDAVTDARLCHVTEAARLNESSRVVAANSAELNRAIELRDAVIAKLEAIRQEVADAIQAMAAPGTEPLAADMPLTQLEAWLERREQALEIWADIKDAGRDIEQATSDGEAACTRILDLLSATGVTHDKNATLETLLNTARLAVDHDKERRSQLRRLRDDIEEHGRDLEARFDDLKNARDAGEKWTRSWNEAVESCWLSNAEKTPTTGAVRQILNEVAALGPAIEKRAGLLDRIAKMEADKEGFVEEVRSLTTELDEDFSEENALEATDRLRARVEQARQNRKLRDAKSEELDKAGARRRETAEELKTHEARKAEMTGLFGVTTLAEVNKKLNLVNQRAALNERKSELEEQIINTLRHSSFDEAQEALTAVERDALDKEAWELEARFEDQDQRTQDLFAEHSKAVDAIEEVGGDASVARIDEGCQTILLEIEQEALRYLRLKVGIAAAEHALRAYRDKHRNSMMVQASNAFQTISRGAYTSLTTRLDKDTEVLIGLMAAGGSKLAAEMSKGTRFQLYLALRVAGYHEFTRTRQSLPFIADDILETFDDFRAEETFRVFGDMAEKGQVIYLTHHRHLCDIARTVCPSVRVHELPEPEIALAETAVPSTT